MTAWEAGGYGRLAVQAFGEAGTRPGCPEHGPMLPRPCCDFGAAYPEDSCAPVWVCRGFDGEGCQVAPGEHEAPLPRRTR